MLLIHWSASSLCTGLSAVIVATVEAHWDFSNLSKLGIVLEAYKRTVEDNYVPKRRLGVGVGKELSPLYPLVEQQAI